MLTNNHFLMKESYKVTTWTRKGGAQMGLECDIPESHYFVQFFMFIVSSLVTRYICRICCLAFCRIFLKSLPSPKHIQYTAKRHLLLKSRKDENRLRENEVIILQQESLLLMIIGVLKLYCSLLKNVFKMSLI